VCAILPAFREIAGRGREDHMIQRFLGVSIGALVTFLILWFSTVTNPVDLMPWYVAAAVIGAIASFLWPVVIGFWLGRRARARRDESIQKEVDKQLAEQNKG
jgi:Na+/pantothenate symporter